MNIPIIIVCYNNFKYVKNTLTQIIKINKEYYNNIQILDNNSTCLETIEFLKNVDVKVIYNYINISPTINEFFNKHVYDNLPETFIITDPDLQLNENIPHDFIQILLNLSYKYKFYKIGFALDISDFDEMYNDNSYFMNKSIYDLEIEFWKYKINNNEYELYFAPIDTTFCLINKKYINSNIQCRIAGNFTAKHLPWYINNKIFNLYETYLLNLKTTNVSTISKVIYNYIENNYLKIHKNDEIILIKNVDNCNLNFWKNIYTYWENDSFNIFDKFLDKNKIFIDIGSWIGTTSIYGCRKSNHVYCIEAENEAFNDLSLNLELNCNNYTLINKAIYNVDNIDVKFGKNKFLVDSKLNDSTSQIYDENDISSEINYVKTITFQNIINNYNININEISLIKVDIEGGEEFILFDLYCVHLCYKTPIYISFHYSWWKDKNLERFYFLTEGQKNNIIKNPFISILFE